jgi:hypothetical protein
LELLAAVTHRRFFAGLCEAFAFFAVKTTPPRREGFAKKRKAVAFSAARSHFRSPRVFTDGVLTMYKPNFCAECGTKLLRLRWHFWTSRKFCGRCARRLRKARLTSALLAALALLSVGYVAGRIRRPAPPPLIIERRSDSPLNDTELGRSTSLAATTASGVNPTEAQGSAPASVEEAVYLCGARTKKGTPCSRRVHGPVRCWQHKGMPAMLPQEKLLVKD